MASGPAHQPQTAFHQPAGGRGQGSWGQRGTPRTRNKQQWGQWSLSPGGGPHSCSPPLVTSRRLYRSRQSVCHQAAARHHGKPVPSEPSGRHLPRCSSLVATVVSAGSRTDTSLLRPPKPEGSHQHTHIQCAPSPAPLSSQMNRPVRIPKRKFYLSPA